METKDIITYISKERGIDSIGKSTLDFVPLNDLNVHRKEIWSLSVTEKPEDYFFTMDRKSGNKICYHFKFEVPDLETAKKLCDELSENFGTSPCAMSSSISDVVPPAKLYLAIHIHPEFSFTPKKNKINSPTQQLILNFV